MTDRLRAINSFRCDLRGRITELKKIQKVLEGAPGPKATLKALSDVEFVHIACRFWREQRGTRHLVYESLFGDSFFSEATTIITNLWWQAGDARDFIRDPERAQEVQDTHSMKTWTETTKLRLSTFEVELDEAITRLSEICEDLWELGRGAGTGSDARGSDTTGDGEWSKPMTKTNIMLRLGFGLKGYRTLNTYAKDHPVRQVANNRQLWQIRIDKMPQNLKAKFK